MVPLAGCDGGTQPWHLTVQGELIESNGQYQFNGEVELSGNPTDVTVTGARVRYLDSNQTQLGSNYVGDFSGLGIRNFSQTLPAEPKYIIVEVDKIHNPTGADYMIEGAVINKKQGEYISTINFTEYDPIY